MLRQYGRAIARRLCAARGDKPLYFSCEEDRVCWTTATKVLEKSESKMS